MNQKNIVFYVGTEYQLLISLAIIADNFADSKVFNNIILISKAEKRFEKLPKFSELKFGIESYVIEIDFNDYRISNQLKNKFKLILNRKVNAFYYFLEIDNIAIYLLDIMRSKKVKICLAPDGLKAYNQVFTIPFYFRLKVTFLRYIYYLTKALWVKHIYFYKNGYTNYMCNDEIWLTHPELFTNNKFNKPLKKINTDIVNTLNKELNSVFQYSNEEERISEHDYLYISQPFDNKMIDYECDHILTKLGAKGQIAVKLHPQTSHYAINRYKNVSNVTVIYSNTPVEIIISRLKMKKIFSPWSGSLLINNPYCEFYWLYPLFSDFKYGTMINIPIIPNHIKVVIAIEEII